jgi:N-acetyl-gamma-glutamyl-phosphate reductase
MVRVGIYGATGYTGLELIRLLRRHAQAQIAWGSSRSYAGQRLSDAFATVDDLPLVDESEADLAAVDAVFCCLPHGVTAPTVRRALAAGVRVLDLSADFRLSAADYQRWYGKAHEAPELLPLAVYGLPELHRERIREARLVACPGCYPTSVILPLYPLRRAGLLAEGQHVIADSKSGVSGAGRSLSLKTHFVEANNNFSAYNIGRRHRHIAEMEQETGLRLTFSPHLLPLNNGILSTIYVSLKPGTHEDELREAFAIYRDEPFARLLPTGKLPTLRHVVGTNLCLIGIQPVDVERGEVVLVSCEDNLLKGASGQAVQNFNIMFGLPETLGLL